MKHEIKICALLAALLLTAPSCAPRSQKQPAVRTSDDAKKSEIEAILAKADEYVASGDYKSALDYYKIASEKYPKDGLLEEGYIATLEDIKTASDKAFDEGNFTLSGKTYYLLLRNVPQSNGFSVGLSFTKKSLTKRIDECRSALSQQALGQYREGNIDTAISLWKSVLSFDPGNKSIKRSIDTATTQLKNLKQKN